MHRCYIYSVLLRVFSAAQWQQLLSGFVQQDIRDISHFIWSQPALQKVEPYLTNLPASSSNIIPHLVIVLFLGVSRVRLTIFRHEKVLYLFPNAPNQSCKTSTFTCRSTFRLMKITVILILNEINLKKIFLHINSCIFFFVAPYAVVKQFL